MDTIEAILNGENEETEWIHYAQGRKTAPQYMKEHQQNITEAELTNLEYDTKYRAEPQEEQY